MLKRNRVVSILMMPAAISLWAIGWILSLAGEKKSGAPKQKPQNQMSHSSLHLRPVENAQQ